MDAIVPFTFSATQTSTTMMEKRPTRQGGKQTAHRSTAWKDEDGRDRGLRAILRKYFANKLVSLVLIAR